jgi:hypothetical protein
METVSLLLSSPWPTDAGLRRPIEGPITFSIKEAVRIVDTQCGEPVDNAGKKLIAAAKKAAAKEAAEKEAAEKLAADKAEAERLESEKLAAEKEAAEKDAAEKDAQSGVQS